MNAPTTRVIGIFTVLASLNSGCKEDPPPPPPLPTATTAAQAPDNTVSAQVQRMSPEATKLYRVDMCFFGSQGLRYLSEAYLASLGGKEPSATNVPSFGEYPDPRALPRTLDDKEADAEKAAPDQAAPDQPATKTAPEGKPADAPATEGKGRPGGKTGGVEPPAIRPPVSAVRQVPFLKYLRYCAVAKQLKQPATPELDAALTAFDKYASPLNRTLVESSRYFGAKQYERDEFKRGKALHEKLSEGLPKSGEELDKLQKAVEDFKKGLAPLPDELDEGGKIAQRGYDEARAATLLFLAEEVDVEAVKTEVEKLKKTYDELVAAGEKEAAAPHPKVVAPKIAALVGAIEGAVEAGAKTAEARYPVFIAMADLVENMQRALAQLLNRRGGGKATPPMRMLKPRLRPGDRVPPRIRPRETPSVE